jgi:hypothetical protein
VIKYINDNEDVSNILQQTKPIPRSETNTVNGMLKIHNGLYTYPTNQLTME